MRLVLAFLFYRFHFFSVSWCRLRIEEYRVFEVSGTKPGSPIQYTRQSTVAFGMVSTCLWTPILFSLARACLARQWIQFTRQSSEAFGRFIHVTAGRWTLKVLWAEMLQATLCPCSNNITLRRESTTNERVPEFTML